MKFDAEENVIKAKKPVLPKADLVKDVEIVKLRIESVDNKRLLSLLRIECLICLHAVGTPSNSLEVASKS